MLCLFPLQVSSIPAVVGLRGGEVVGEFVGLRDAHFLKEFAHNLVTSPATET